MGINGFADEWNVSKDQCWNGTDGGKLKNSERNSPRDIILSMEGPI